MARMSVRQMWRARLEGRLAPVAAAGPVEGRRSPFAGCVLGVDPSLRGTGLAVVDFQPGRPAVLLMARTVRVPARRTLAEALAEIHREVTALLDKFPVRHVALEQTIYVQNVRTAQILGAARGAAIAAAALRDRPVYEYPPLRVKQAVVGVGRASKEQMQRTVRALLDRVAGWRDALSADEADATGVALCHALTWRDE